MVFFAEVTASEVQRTAKLSIDENFARIEMRFLGQEREQTAKILFRGGKSP